MREKEQLVFSCHFNLVIISFAATLDGKLDTWKFSGEKLISLLQTPVTSPYSIV